MSRSKLIAILHSRSIRWAAAAAACTTAMGAVAPTQLWAAPSASAVLSRLKSMVGRADKDIADIEKQLSQQMIPVVVNSIERSFGRLDKLFGEMDEKLASVPEGEAGRADMAAQLAALKGKRDALYKRYQAAANSGAERLKEIEAAAPTDAPQAERLATQLREVSLAAEADGGELETVKRHKELASEAEALVAKYADFRPNADQSSAVREVLIAVLTLNKRLTVYKEQTLPSALNDGPAAMANTADRLKSMVDSAIKEKRFHDFHNGIPSAVAALRFRAEVYEALCQGQPGYKPDATAAARAAADAAEQAGASLKSDIIAANVPREDLYKGSDGDKWRSLAKNGWQSAYPQHKVVKVVLRTEQWDRRKGYEFDASRRAWAGYDFSFIQVDVYVASEDGKYGYRYFGRLLHDHRAGTAPKMMTEMVSAGPPRAPAAIFPMARLK